MGMVKKDHVVFNVLQKCLYFLCGCIKGTYSNFNIIHANAESRITTRFVATHIRITPTIIHSRYKVGQHQRPRNDAVDQSGGSGVVDRLQFTNAPAVRREVRIQLLQQNSSSEGEADFWDRIVACSPD